MGPVADGATAGGEDVKGGEAVKEEDGVVGDGNGQDVQSVPDSPMLENSPSFGSTSLSPSLVNLPPIRVHMEDGGGGGGGGRIGVQDQKIGIEKQFAQMTVSGGVGQEQDDSAFVVFPAPPQPQLQPLTLPPQSQ
ncbi:hypothetical protein ACFX15_039833 [Malus domestica]